MIKKVCFYIFLFFCLLLNIVIDLKVPKYFGILSKCFDRDIILASSLYILICFIVALISALIVVDILLVFYKKEKELDGFKLKIRDGTFGTANWMPENEIANVLGSDKIPGIILGKYNGNIIKLPLTGYFNKNICIFR
ncbi:MAG: hypothetical protein HFJ52_01695 [Clostridia bacterium]|jgi:type IV secretory pathway TraG/TraD family ATPase VirD4|nr:hypothetical protein [Clostridia bacterium]